MGRKRKSDKISPKIVKEEPEDHTLRKQKSQPSPIREIIIHPHQSFPQIRDSKDEADEEEFTEEAGEEDREEEDDDIGHTLDPYVCVDSSEEGEESMETMLESFTKEQLLNIVVDAAKNHADVTSRVLKVANEDPSHRKIFVHGLGWDTTAETLVESFQEYGEIEDCKAVCDKLSGKSKGYGFILFKTRKGARNSLKQPQKKIGNRMTASQLACIGPVPVPSVSVLAPNPSFSEYTQRKIFVSNVSTELDPHKLFAFFSGYGEIEQGPLGLDKHTGRPKGFCLFVYRTAEGAMKALEEPHKSFDGHVLHCQKAIDGPKLVRPSITAKPVVHNPLQFHRSDAPTFVGQPHLMAPSAPGMSLTAGAHGIHPAIGQALSALLATPGAGVGLNNLLGTMAPPAVHGMAGGYANPGVGVNVNPGLVGGYVNQVGYPSHQFPHGGALRPQQGSGPLGGVAPYTGH